MSNHQKKLRSYVLTKESRYEADTVGQHGTLDGVEFGQDDEDHQCQPECVQALHDDDKQEVPKGRLPPGLEEAYPEGAQECTELRDCECDQETPGPGNPLFRRQVYYKLLVSPCKQNNSLCLQ